LVIGLLATGVFIHGFNPSKEATSGPYAEFTRSDLSRLIAFGQVRNAVLLPRDLPPGTERTDESDFYLLNKPVTDDARRHAGEVWLTSYSVGALPPATGNVTGYSVYQEWQQTPERHLPRCSPNRSGNKVVVRQVGDDKLTICLGPNPTKTSRKYWSTVDFTSQLSEVEWLRDGGR
jgi:hypothetical protein